jgi:hypothetical protein
VVDGAGFEPFLSSAIFFQILFMYMWEWTALSINFICIFDFLFFIENRSYILFGGARLKKHVMLLVVFLITFSSIVSIILINQGNEERTYYFQAVRWTDGAAPDDYIEVATLPLKYEIISLTRESANSGSILISESSSIWEWAEEIMKSPFGSVDIKISEMEYYYITVR